MFGGIRPHPRSILHDGLFNRKLMIFGEFPTKSFPGALPEKPANHARTSCEMPEQQSIVEWTCDQENALDLPRFVAHLNDRFNGVEGMLDCRVVPWTDMRGRLRVPILRRRIRGQVGSPSHADETIAAGV
jgi:hypothetical protein